MFMTLAFEVLAFVAFAVLVAGVPYVRRKRGYWTSRGVQLASGRRALAATLPGARLDDRSLNRHRDVVAAVLGLHDGGRPCALACDARVAAAAMANDGFADGDARPDGRGCSLVPSVVDAQSMVAVLPSMTECVAELITSLEAVANRRLDFAPWSEAKQCAAAVVATCVYGQPMIHSKVKLFAEQCDRALSGGRRPAATDYFTAYDLSADRAPSSTDFKRLLTAAAANDDRIGSDVADEQVRLDMFEFVVGAIEPTAALVTAALYELARDKEVQNRLRDHLDSVLEEHQQQIAMDQLDRLSYLKNVLRETLRKYPLATAVRRVTTRPYAVPDPRSSGGGRDCVTLEQGTMTVVPVYAIHHDGRNFDQPAAFRPHRFPGQLSAAYVPHGSGPRSYIGKHFVELEAMLILAMLISRYEVHVDSGKPVRSPDPFDLTSFAGVRLVVTSRKGDRLMGESLRKVEQCVRQERKFLFF